KIIHALFSPNGNRVIFETESDDGLRISVGTIVKGDTGASELDSTALPLGSSNAAFANDGSEVYYLRTTANGAEAHAYDVADWTDRILFTIPFSAAHAAWGTPAYIYTKPTESLLGYVYRVAGSALAYVRGGGFGL